MFPFDEDDEGEVSFGEQSDAEREMTPEIPKAPSVRSFDDGGDFEGASDVESGTLRAFVAAVIYANVAVLFVALGPMVWYFEGWTRIGAGLSIVGILAGVRTYQTYRAWRRDRDSEDGDPDVSADPNSDTDAAADSDPNSDTDAAADSDPNSDTDAAAVDTEVAADAPPET